MPKLRPRRHHEARRENWRIYYGDIRVGMIGRRAGIPPEADQWGWSCGFYPGLEPGQYQAGTSPTFEAARVALEAAWERLLPNLSEEDFAAYRRPRALHDWKTMMWDCGCRLPTQEPGGRSKCWCGASIDLDTFASHVYIAHMTPV